MAGHETNDPLSRQFTQGVLVEEMIISRRGDMTFRHTSISYGEAVYAQTFNVLLVVKPIVNLALFVIVANYVSSCNNT